MTLHTLSEMGSAESAAYGLLANMLETSMLSLFLNVSYADRELCEKSLKTAEVACIGMTGTLTGLTAGTLPAIIKKAAAFTPSLKSLGDIGLLFTFPAWREYLFLMSVILGCEAPVLENTKPKIPSCSKYWEKWEI